MRARAAAAAGVSLVFALVAFTTLLPALAPGSAGATLAALWFAPLCHQDAARSFAIDGHTLAVCHRCAGIYFGLAVGGALAFLVPIDPRARWPWIVGGAPMALQVLAGWASPALDLFWLRTLTGLLAGGVGGLMLASALGTLGRPRAADYSSSAPP